MPTPSALYEAKSPMFVVWTRMSPSRAALTAIARAYMSSRMPVIVRPPPSGHDP